MTSFWVPRRLSVHPLNLVDGVRHRNTRKESVNTISPISILPTELLVEILTHLFWESCNDQECEPPGLAVPTRATAFNLHSPSLFHYNVALACRRWKDICSAWFPSLLSRAVVILSSSGNLTLGMAGMQASSPFLIQAEAEDQREAYSLASNASKASGTLCLTAQTLQ